MSSNLSPRVWDALRPPSKQTVAEWAGQNRVISEATSSRPGRWRHENAPYLKEIMDAVNDPTVQFIAMMTSAQVGKSELLLNVMARYICLEPCTILLVMQTLNDAEAWSNTRIIDMVNSTPALRAVMPAERSRSGKAQVLLKKFRGGILRIVGSNSASGLASTTARILLCDEVDRYPAEVGRGDRREGDPLAIAVARTVTYGNTRKVIMVSTPSTETGSRIKEAYNEGDRCVFDVPCPECGHEAPLKFGALEESEAAARAKAGKAKKREEDHAFTLRWQRSADGGHRPDTVKILCRSCGVLLPASARDGMVQRGQWRATAKPQQGHRSFHLWSGLNLTNSLEEIVRDFIKAKVNPLRLQVFVNTALGETFEPRGEALDWRALQDKAALEEPTTIPADMLLLTASADIQENRIEYFVAAWDEHETCHGVEHIVLPGETDDWSQGAFAELYKVLGRDYQRADGMALRPAIVCIDIGYNGSQCLKFIAKRKGRVRLEAIKGAAATDAPIIATAIPERKKIKTREHLAMKRPAIYHLGTHEIKNILYERFKRKKGKPGSFQFGPDFGDEWYRQLTSEHRVEVITSGRPKKMWQLRSGRRNEALDLAVYAYAGLSILHPDWPALKAARNARLRQQGIEPEGRGDRKALPEGGGKTRRRYRRKEAPSAEPETPAREAAEPAPKKRLPLSERKRRSRARF